MFIYAVTHFFQKKQHTILFLSVEISRNMAFAVTNIIFSSSHSPTMKLYLEHFVEMAVG
jgi:hypothetical protein